MSQRAMLSHCRLKDSHQHSNTNFLLLFQIVLLSLPNSPWNCLSLCMFIFLYRHILFMPSFLDKISSILTNRVDRKKGSSDISGNHIYCRFCGRKNRVSLTICQDCKQSMDVPPSQMLKVCTKCGSAINNDDAYCYSCGTSGF
jgi:hypothetical protein